MGWRAAGRAAVVLVAPVLLILAFYGGLLSFLEIKDVAGDRMLTVAGTPVTAWFAAVASAPMLLLGFLVWWGLRAARRPARATSPRR